VDIHFWKCYSKDGASFQTAKLFSVEVDYYTFGTCRLLDGAYFCGDHSCQTYKHIGQKHTKRSREVVDRVVDTEWPRSAGDPLGSAYAQPWAGDSRFVKNVGFEEYSTAARAIDQTMATYGRFDGRKINVASANSMAVATTVRGAGVISDLSVDSSSEAPAVCKLSCNADTSCIAYALHKGFATSYASCLHYTRSELPIVVGLDLQGVMDTDAGWETYVKITNEKRRSWMHAETQPKGYHGTLDLPTTRGNGGPARRMEELY